MAVNVLLWSIDALRGDCIGPNMFPPKLLAHGIPRKPDTPSFDALLARGTFFSNGFSAAPYTTASHASVFSGRWTCNHGLREHFRAPMRKDVPNIFEIYRAHGYTTIFCNDMPNIFSEVLGFHRGVDHYLSFDHSRLLELLDELGETPIFLFLHFGDVHFPYGLVKLEVTGDAKFAAEVDKITEISGLEFDPKGTRMLDFAQIKDPKEWKYIQHYFQAMMRLYRDKRYGDLMRLYCQSVEEMDRGRFRHMAGELDQRGWMDRAHICLMGDHGEDFSDRCFMHHDSVVEGAVHVPIAFTSPDLPICRTDDAIVRTIDILPTLLDLSGIEVPSGLDGTCLNRRMRQKTPLDLVAKGEAFLYRQKDAALDAEVRNRRLDLYEQAVKEKKDLRTFDWPEPTLQLSYARDGRWKLMVIRDLIAMSEKHFLYDLKADAMEAVDLSDAQPRARSSLRQELNPFIDAALDQERSLAKTDANRILNELADMGYLHGRTPTN